MVATARETKRKAGRERCGLALIGSRMNPSVRALDAGALRSAWAKAHPTIRSGEGGLGVAFARSVYV